MAPLLKEAYRMTWKPVTKESIHGVGMEPFLWGNLTIPKLWATCQETSTQSKGQGA